MGELFLFTTKHCFSIYYPDIEHKRPIILKDSIIFYNVFHYLVYKMALYHHYSSDDLDFIVHCGSNESLLSYFQKFKNIESIYELKHWCEEGLRCKVNTCFEFCVCLYKSKYFILRERKWELKTDLFTVGDLLMKLRHGMYTEYRIYYCKTPHQSSTKQRSGVPFRIRSTPNS
jgi:hypothetical protein